MKLRFLLVSALALVFLVPAALAATTDEAPAGKDASTEVDKPKKDGDHATDEKHEKAKKHDQAKKRKKYKKHSMRGLCRPRVAVIVRGDLVAVDAEAGTFTVLVDKANRHGKRFVDTEVTFNLAKKVKVRKHGKTTLAHVQEVVAGMDGYRVKVMGRACRSELRDMNEPPVLYAKHVKVKAPAPEHSDEAKDGDEKEETGGSDEKPTDSEGTV